MSCISQRYYDQHLAHLPINSLHSLLYVEGLGGLVLPYSGCIEAELQLPGTVIGPEKNMMALFLIVENTAYTQHCPVLIGTNIISHLCALHPDFVNEDNLPRARKVAFQYLQTESALRAVSRSITIKAAVAIPSMSGVVLDGCCDELHCSKATPILVEPCYDATLPGGLCITPTLYDSTNISVKVPVHVVNTTQRVVTIPENCIVGSLTSAKVVENATASSEDEPLSFEKVFPLDHLTEEQRRAVYQCLA